MDSGTEEFFGCGEDVANMSGEEWEELGRDISNNDHLREINLCNDALNDQTMSFLFRGLTRSSSIECMKLQQNHFHSAGVRSMVPFLQNANNLIELDLDDSSIQSEGFNVLVRALCGSPIERLHCRFCGIESIEIDSEHKPKHLKSLFLTYNRINADGCRGLAEMLKGGDSTLTTLHLQKNKIDDEGVEILVNTLEKNESLKTLYLNENDGISIRGEIMLLKAVNDISSIEATLRSNHTLAHVSYTGNDNNVRKHIDMAARINRMYTNLSKKVVREKIIRTQLNSEVREQMADLQGVDHSVYNEIDPLHLPEVLSLIGEKNGQGELYKALLSSIMALFSTVDMKKCIQEQMEYHAAKAAEYVAMAAEQRAKLEELGARLKAIEATEGPAGNDEVEHRSNKRLRT